LSSRRSGSADGRRRHLPTLTEDLAIAHGLRVALARPASEVPVMGLDQHRAQITADWLDIDSGEISRTRVSPADPAGVRRFLERFAGRVSIVAARCTSFRIEACCSHWARR